MAREIVINDELIPWRTLKGRVLEELLYELLHEMGANELIWRSGGTGGGAPDGGRDLEAIFQRPTPDGDIESEQWWLEAKGRSGTVEPAEVKTAVINAAGRKSLDLLVVATNTQFSNPTRDWLDNWMGEHPRPKVKLWDRKDLLRLIRRHPMVAARIIPEILPDSARLRALTDQFYEIGKPPSSKDLKYFWSIRDSIDDVDEIACLAYGELLYGDFSSRPWGVLITEGNALEAAIEALVCLPFIMLRANTLSSETLTTAAAYMVQSALRFVDPSQMAEVLARPFEFVEGLSESLKHDPGPYLEAIVTPIWTRCKGQLLDACSQDCPRINGDLSILRPSEADQHFWRRFNMEIKAPGEDGILHLCNLHQPCAVGFDLGDRTCPLEEEPSFSESEVRELATVINYRRVRPDGRFLEIIKSDRSTVESISGEIDNLIKRRLSTPD